METKTEPNANLLAPGFSLRNVTWDDVTPVVELIRDVCIMEGNPIMAINEDDLRSEWNTEGFRPETDAWVVTASDGRVVGYEELFNRHAHASLTGDGYVHPNYLGNGIGTALMRALEARARLEVPKAPSEARVFLRNGMGIHDTVACQLHENEGYRPIRYNWHMSITLTDAPPAPQWPQGVELRPFITGQHERVVFEAQDEAFRDHWGHTPGDFNQWLHHRVERDDFDPNLWYIAWDGDKVAGVALCRYRQGSGWVGSLGVRRPWRKRGLGLALLQHAFGDFHRRGTNEVGLGVDAANPTGATRLYQRAGMRVESEFVIYEKELRPGIELGEDE